MPDELAATSEPGGPGGPVDPSWLILQRLDDLHRGQEDLHRGQEDLHRGQEDLGRRIGEVEAGLRSQTTEVTALRTRITETTTALHARIGDLKKDTDWVRNYALSIVLVAVLGLLVRSFVVLH